MEILVVGAILMFILIYNNTIDKNKFFADNEKVFLNISSLALHALLMSVVGAAMLIILHHKEGIAKQKA